MTDNIKLPPMPESIFHGCGELWTLIDKWSRADPGLNASVAANAINDAITRLMNKHAIEAVRLNAQAVPDTREMFNAGWCAAARFCDREDAVYDGLVGPGGCPAFESAYRDAWTALSAAPAAPPQPTSKHRPDRQWYARMIQETLDDDFAIGPAFDAKAVPEISTEHGPWVESNIHEGETYCERCLVRSVFAGCKKCEPHIVSAPAAPQPAQPADDESDALTVAYLHRHGKGKDSVQPLLAEKDVLLRQALGALEAYSKSGYVRHEHPKKYAAGDAVAEAIRNHLGVKP